MSIIHKIEYTKEHKVELKKAWDSLKEPDYFGEDGDLIVIKFDNMFGAGSAPAALKKFKKLEMETGEKTQEEVDKEMLLEDVGISFLHLVDKDNPDHKIFSDSDVFVDFKGIKSDYPVWCFRIF